MTDILLKKINAAGTDIYSYVASNNATLSIDMDSPVSPMPLPEDTADTNILIKVEGNTSVWNVTWLIKTEVTNQVTGTNSETKTFAQQLIFLLDEFTPKSIADKYKIVFNDVTPFSKEGTFTKFTFRLASTEPVTIQASASFIVGDVVSVFESDTPQPPTGVAAVAGGGTKELDVSWVAPTDIGGSALTEYVVSYRTQSSGWTHKVVTVPSVSVTLNNGTDGIAASTTYSVRVRARNSLGTSFYSDIITGTSSA